MATPEIAALVGAQASRLVGNDRSAALRRTAQILRRPGMTETPGINPGARSGAKPVQVAKPPVYQDEKPNRAAGMPNGVPPRLQALAAKDPAAAQARYAQFRAGELPGQQKPEILTAMPEKPGMGVGREVDQAPGYWTPERMAQAKPIDNAINTFPAPDGKPWYGSNPFMDIASQPMSQDDPQFQSGGGFMGEPMPVPRLRGFAPQGATPDFLEAIRSARGAAGPGAAAPGASLAQRLAGAVGPKPDPTMFSTPSGPGGAYSPGISDPLTPEPGYPADRAARPVGGPNLLRRRPGLGANPEAAGMGGYGSGGAGF